MGKTYRGRERDWAKKAADRRRKQAKQGFSKKDSRQNRNWRDFDEYR